ncbi:MAG: hypothetical protein HN478_09245 [Rhodospirillaceae bacterium]|jgi:acetolactate synthase small subunit|nr:hypothetical protein [Rhodospirillaceae bacterium]MBT4487037.1 hypothetical protein [Rhodospirillaceae bacterium]MBT5191039.1 hypothetical protein [Rhodospirillaceae bacterium]MBT5899021.1 hypothetical protein [Rhodospirillaceae bacterium]MBT6426699.1 hypothetical protein [Rhodospirillaceae bacterium]
MTTQTERSEPQNGPSTQAGQNIHRFMIHAEAEASTLSRVIELFALRDLIPDEVSCKRAGDDGLHIHIAITGVPENQAANLADRMRNIIPVMRVVLEPAPHA